tara:strand:- start:330 stop:701 length:372 start_codon:yes stop_codon:yes gene_type:complete
MITDKLYGEVARKDWTDLAVRKLQTRRGLMFLLTIKIEDWESGVSQFKKSVLTRIQESAPDDENPFKKYEFLEQFLCSIQANMLDQKVDETFVAGLTNLSKVDIASCQKAAGEFHSVVLAARS